MYAAKLLVAGLAGAYLANAASDLDKREETCFIISPDGSTAIHCRSCPSLSCDVVTTVSVGDKVDFSGYASGDCYEDNCTWDFNKNNKCYVNGYYTSSNCNHKVLSSMIISTSGLGSTSTTSTGSSPTGSERDTNFGPTTTFNPAATATSTTPVQSTSTSGSSPGLAGEESTGLRFVYHDCIFASQRSEYPRLKSGT
ncbi:hypothetical protein PISL3812_09051 [Talaromyces islandicus]|uniref:Uncharacterized protein n=1 Tax=Talaromyces islandicus TaxID=28573 RepID=A0A0U1M8R2_TALIS|nr:hypothetical protein PISL3812_09051 [Talaromyces islandicus]